MTWRVAHASTLAAEMGMAGASYEDRATGLTVVDNEIQEAILNRLASEGFVLRHVLGYPVNPQYYFWRPPPEI